MTSPDPVPQLEPRLESQPQEPAPGQLVTVNADFYEKVKRPGGVKREVGLQKAETTLISAHAEIRAELDSNFDLTLQLADKLKTVSSPEIADLLRLRKSTRQMRDVGALAQYPLITVVAGMMVDYLNRQIEGKTKHRPDVLSCLTDSLTMARGQALRGAQPEDAPKLMANLHMMMSTVTAA